MYMCECVLLFHLVFFICFELLFLIFVFYFIFLIFVNRIFLSKLFELWLRLDFHRTLYFFLLLWWFYCCCLMPITCMYFSVIAIVIFNNFFCFVSFHLLLVEINLISHLNATQHGVAQSLCMVFFLSSFTICCWCFFVVVSFVSFKFNI